MEHITSASQAFDLHTRYLEYRHSHPTMDRLLHLGYYRGALERNAVDAVSRENLEAEMEKSAVYSAVATALDNVIISRADTVFLTDDLRELVNTAEATMPDEVLFETDIYTPCGFVVMETPLQIDIHSRAKASEFESLIKLVEEHGGVIAGEREHQTPDEFGDLIGVEHWNIHAFSWGDADVVIPEALTEITKKHGVGSEQHKFATLTELGLTNEERVLYVRVHGTMTATTIDGVTLDVPELRKAPLRLVNSYAFFYGENGPEQEAVVHGVDNPEEPAHAMLNRSWEQSRQVRRFLVALFRLMEEYVEIEATGLHRAFGKRATRSGRVGDTKNVTILSLRRALDDDEDGSGIGRKVTLAHLVRGHWRNQWYPSQKQHRAKWIRAHRRGGNAGDEVVERPRIIKVDR